MDEQAEIAICEKPSLGSYLATILRDSAGFMIPPRTWPGGVAFLVYMFVVPCVLLAPVVLVLGLNSQLEHERQQRRLGLRGSDYAELLLPVLIEHNVDLRRGHGESNSRLEEGLKRLRADPDLAAWFDASHAAFDGHLDLGERPVNFFGVGHWDSELAETLGLSFQAVERQSNSAIPASIFAFFVLFFIVPAFVWVRIVAFGALGLLAAPISRLGLLACASYEERLTMRVVLLAFVFCPLIEMGVTWLAIGLEPGPSSAALVRHLLPDPLGRGLAMGFTFAFSVAAVAVAYQFVEVVITGLLAFLGGKVPSVLPFVASNGLAVGVLSLAGANAISLGIAFSMVLVATLLRSRTHVRTGVPTIVATALLLVVSTITLSQLEGRSREPAWYEKFPAPQGLNADESTAVRKLLERTRPAVNRAPRSPAGHPTK